MSIKKILLITLIATCAILSAAPTISFKLDRENCLYKCGEKATFTVQFTDDANEPFDKTVSYTLKKDNYNLIKKGSIDLSQTQTFTISETMDSPSFLRLTFNCSYTDKDGKKVKMKEKFATAAAGFEPEKIQAATPYPEDFMEYWKGELQKADKECPLDVQMTKMDKYCNAKCTSYKVSFAAPGGRVYGFLCIPTKQGKLPAIVNVPGAGPGYERPYPNDNFVLLMMNVHSYDPCIEGKKIKDSYAELNKAGSYPTQGRTREGTFFHRPIIGIARAIEWLANRPEVDPARIGYYGSSQGGAFGLIQAGLTGRFAAVTCNVPAMCDHFGAQMKRAAGWPQYRGVFKIKNAKGNTSYDPETDKWVPYYDAANFARYIKCPIRLIVGFIDSTCSPSSVYAAFNNIPAQDKEIINVPDMGHETREGYGKAQEWVRSTISK